MKQNSHIKQTKIHTTEIITGKAKNEYKIKMQQNKTSPVNLLAIRISGF